MWNKWDVDNQGISGNGLNQRFTDDPQRETKMNITLKLLKKQKSLKYILSICYLLQSQENRSKFAVEGASESKLKLSHKQGTND